MRMKYLNIKNLDTTTHAYLKLQAALAGVTMEEYAINAIKEKLVRDGIDAGLLVRGQREKVAAE